MTASALARSDLQRTIVGALDAPGFIHVKAEDVRRMSGGTEADWSAFAEQWDHLEVDKYMADGGTYRRRRYSQLDLDTATSAFTVTPHGPYRQPRSINHLNGGVERHFEPCTEAFLSSPVLQGLLPSLGEAFAQATGVTRWNVRLHPYRISASDAEVGQPAPEGLHRDGVTFIMTLMVNRVGVHGGESSIHDNEGTELYRATLAERGELLLADDARTLHGVTPVVPALPAGGHRDVLVIAFTDPSDD